MSQNLCAIEGGVHTVTNGLKITFMRAQMLWLEFWTPLVFKNFGLLFYSRILDSSSYKVFKIVLDILIVLQSLSGQVVRFDDFLLSPPSPPHIGLPLTHSASRNVTILNCIPDYILMSSAFEISPTPSKSHQRAVTDKIQCLLGTKLFTICKMNCKFFYKGRFSRLVFIFKSKF